MCAAAAAYPKGLKRICPNCGTRYYDLNKRPIACPNCATEFKLEPKTKGRRGRLPAANDEKRAVAPVAVEEETLEVAAEADDDTISLDEAEELEDDAEDEDVDALDPDIALEADDEVIEEDEEETVEDVAEEE